MSHLNFDFLKDLGLEQQVENLLSTSLKRTVEGSNEIYRTPLGKDLEPDAILKLWDEHFEEHSAKLTEPLLDLETSNRSKFGPRSIAVPWEERKELVSAYFGNDKQNYTSPIHVAPSTKGRLRPWTLQNATLQLKNNTNSGLPFYTKKKNVKVKVLENFEYLLDRKDPCILFTRTQEQKKTRAVWGFPIADTLNEMRYYRPVLEIQKKTPWRSAVVHPTAVDEAVTRLLLNARQNRESMVSIDFSAYDATVRKNLQTASFEYIKEMFQSQYHDEIDYIADRFLNIGLVTPEGVWPGPHGVPSGSTFTNEVDSIAQFLCAKSIDPTLEDYQIQGDDGVYRTKDPDSLKQGFKDFGLNVNDEKSYVSDDYVVYLQNLYSIDYIKNGTIGGIYPTYRALNRLIFQERFDDFKAYDIEGSDFYSIRAISILENCRHHPCYEIFVKFIVKLDKYGLKPSQHGIQKYIKMIKDTTGAEGIIAHQYGDAIQGIRSFDTYKLISAL